MSISNFVEKSFLNYLEGDIHTSLSLACSAVDATARKVFNSTNNNVRFKNYIKRYFRIISFYGLPGIVTNGIKIGCTLLKDIKTDENNMVWIEDIIYHTIRCGLLHECDIDKNLRFVDETLIGEKDNFFNIPKFIIIGLLISVVLCKENNNEKLDNNISFYLKNNLITVNDLWGKEDEFSI